MSSEGKRFSSHNVRCCTLIGHVDHGKSSFADSLLAANNIISARMAGQIRYLDSREDEQERGITMEASAVSLSVKMRVHDPTKGWDPENLPPIQDFMINLIDTPGHVDFSSEVSTASRLCDGALLIVDVVEGVCAQTVTVLRQAWQDGLEPILVLNKVDRLITELKLSPNEAYHHLIQVIEQVNAVVGSFFASARMDDDERWHEEREKRIAARKQAKNDSIAASTTADADAAEEDAQDREERDDEDIYFDPSKGNVIFASAMDNWAFRLERFAMLYAKKMGIQESKLRKVLWGDFYFDPKTKRVLSQKQKEKEKRPLKPMFVQFVLENIWSVYDAVVENRDQDKIEKIVTSLSLKVHPRDLKSKDASTLIKAIVSQWLPLASCAFAAIIYVIPPTSKAQAKRIPMMLNPDMSYFDRGNYKAKTALEEHLMKAEIGPKSNRVAYVSKMFAVKKDDLPEAKKAPLTAEQMRERAKESRERQNAVRAALAATGASMEGGADVISGANGTSLEEAETQRAARAQRETEVQAQTDAQKEQEEEEQGSDEVVLGFARLYSGTLRAGQWMYALLPKYNTSLAPSHASNMKHIKAVQLEAIYMIMGRDLVAVNEVPAGNVFAIRGLEGRVLRNATLCSPSLVQSYPIDQRSDPGSIDPDVASNTFVNLAGINLLSAPIVRVALEPVNPQDMPKLVEGLKLLNQADPCVESLIQDTGEHVILTAGELHLERCLKDLRERFAKCEIQVSAPLVPFRETCVRAPEMPPPKIEGAARGTAEGNVANGVVSYRVRAVPLPKAVVDFLLANTQTLRRLQNKSASGGVDEDVDAASGSVDAAGSQASKMVSADKFWSSLATVLEKCGQDRTGQDWREVVEKIVSFGPRRVGANMLVDRTGSGRASLRNRTDACRAATRQSSGIATPSTTVAVDESQNLTDALSRIDVGGQDESCSRVNHLALNESIDSGFQMATSAGPLCAEPMQGLAFFLETISVCTSVSTSLSSVTGPLMSTFRESCKQALLDWSPRLMLAMYSCDIQASTEVLGKVHAVLAKRRGKIISEEMKEGTSFFTVGSLLPVVESFGFADEIRKRTSGAASPQLIFKGFELFDLDPFWVPRTEEELEDLGEKGDRENVAKRYMDAVRKRKGLFVTQRIVENAEKQRTLKSN
ncbi:putative translation elongation factor 2 [Mycosarcoma maydis]|uniref:Ribosome assembly protein 1 n=2 Tax=Mycosarcoma maydis TaxID=5270 RepID=A0A0D1E717_MYCMD|nr:putative translation elongation factor 2 [Ustilago maydis 521]KIS71361.1 putative translation elongation factor 2 [Ustilago maydis 521]|eukprot:XP_011387475.1 putative translation elongation factor 2 [Ustilago maydis 521]